jgi:ATP-dependent exoDNAse (exonuclease V) beta subunit
MAFLGKVNHILEEFKAENNILLISEFNQLIADIVLDEPVPFIYERVGEKYHHFLLDEFQDTSVLQWQNLVPLLENSLAQGYGNLVVGDAKQAIYRWRNGEVEQFISLPKIYGRREGQVHLERELTLAEHFEGKSLDHNYRSRPGIVSFNNGFFRWLSRHISEKEASVYESVSQQIATTAKGGQVQIEFFPPDREDIDFKDHNRKRVLEIIQETCDRGYRFEDIAILCRTNKEAAIIAKDLLTHAVQVVSSESMLLKSSPKVRLLAGVMRLLVEPRDEPVQIEVVNLLLKTGKVSGSLHSLGIRALSKGNREKQNFTGGLIFGFLKESGFALERTSLLALPLYDLCEALMRIFGIDGEPDPFLQFFLDLVLEREDEGGSGIRKFLEYWDRKKESLSIVVPEGLDAVRIMTIHKAKGLEFPVVIYPFVNDRLSVNKDPLWMEMDSPVVPGLGSVLVNSNKSVRETRYGHVVEREIEKIQLDMVNLLYVAFTRPTDELYVIVQHPENMKGSQFSVPAMLLEYLEELNPERPDPLIFRLGSRGNVDRSGKSPGPSYSLDAFNSVDWRSRALISYQAPSNWDVDQPGGRQEWGNLIHRILSEITIAADLMPVLDDYLYHGNVDAREQQLLREMILEFLERPEVGTYFKPGLRVWKEAEIVAPGGALFRPDRIVEVGGEYVVIDFKTGTPSNKHRDQMQQYLDLIRAMMDTPVRGVVLYLDPHAPLHVK